jgi:Tol biopolymer transport system component
MNVSRFDTIVWSTLAILGSLTVVLAWSAEQRGLNIVARTPLPDEQEVSTRASIQVTFDQPLDLTQWESENPPSWHGPLTLKPYVAGTFHWSSAALTFTPASPLEADWTYTVTLSDALRSLQGRPLEGERRWQFATRRPGLLYLAPDQHDVMQLTLMRLDTNQAATLTQSKRLTQSKGDILDYAVSPDSSAVIYAALNEFQGTDVWLLDLAHKRSTRILKCGYETCRHAVWSPDGARVAYERSSSLTPSPRLWWLDVERKETLPVFEDAEQAGYGAGLSADGRWLSYLDPARLELRVQHLSDGRNFGLPNQLGEPPVWHPRSNRLLISDIQFRGERLAAHVFRLDPERETVEEIHSGLADVRDTSPSWSPDGSWVAFSRKFPGADSGRQLVIMQADGSDMFPLTRDPLFEHLAPVWSPDDRNIAFQRISIRAGAAQSEIWLADVGNGKLRQIVSPGKQAAWLP